MAGQIAKSKDEHKQANNTALKLLAICDRSKKDLRDRLLKKGYSAEVVEDVLNNMESMGYVNDSNFAFKFATDAVRRKNIGPDAVRSG
jgi:regulatory protein